jgi:hypothetical protein
MSESEFEKFKKIWETQIADIRNQAIDGDGVASIQANFDLAKTRLQLLAHDEMPDSIYMDVDLLESQLTVALEIAHSRFRLKNRGVLARLFGRAIDKIPTGKGAP